MCCRFYIRKNDPELAPAMEAAAKSPLLARIQKIHPTPLVCEGEVCPTNLVAAFATNRNLQPEIFPMIWGIPVQGRAAPLINARVETAWEKPAFRESWAKHRCAIPASWYYEWQHIPSPDGRAGSKIKYAIQPQDASVTWLCGLYRIENGLPYFVVLTGEASPDVAHIHDRMPLILPKGAIREWINPQARPTDLLQYALTSLAAEKAVGTGDRG